MMLLEAYHYLTTPCRRPYRKLGYLHEAIALLARYRRLQHAWAPHLQRCHALIHEAVERCGSHRRVIVLGSGLGVELPLEELAQRFESVLLVDVVHLRCVRERVRELANVQLWEEDITGLAPGLLGLSRGSTQLPEPRCFIPTLDETVDLIISANLLSQLCLGPLNYAVPRSHFTDEEYIRWCQAIIEGHLRSLRDSSSRVCLFADVVHEQHARDGRLLLREDMLFGVSLPDPAWLWDWSLAPLGELSRHHGVTAEVSGFVNFPLPRY